MKAVILGGTGLVGGILVELLNQRQEVSEIILISRRPFKSIHAKVRVVVCTIDNMEQFTDSLGGDIYYCCIGTTKKKTPDEQEYRKIDYEFPLALAKIALKYNAQQYHLISAIGANINSRSFYLKLKGEVELAISCLGLSSVFIYRPSFISGERKESRPLEKLGGVILNLLAPLLTGKRAKYRLIQAETIAKAMIVKSFSQIALSTSLSEVLESDQIIAIANK